MPSKLLLHSVADRESSWSDIRLRIDPCCRELLTDLEEIRWKVDAHGNTYPELDKRDPKRTHVSDALGYYCAKEHSLTRKHGRILPHGLIL